MSMSISKFFDYKFVDFPVHFTETRGLEGLIELGCNFQELNICAENLQISAAAF